MTASITHIDSYRGRFGEPVPWVRIGPKPHFATCQRCGEHLTPPPLGAIDEFALAVGMALEAHRGCGS